MQNCNISSSHQWRYCNLTLSHRNNVNILLWSSSVNGTSTIGKNYQILVHFRIKFIWENIQISSHFLSCLTIERALKSLRWRQNGRDSVSNHQPGHCLLSLLFGRRSKKTSKLRVTGLCVGNSPGPVNSPHKGPVTRKMFPFDDVIMPSSWKTGSRLP